MLVASAGDPSEVSVVVGYDVTLGVYTEVSCLVAVGTVEVV